MYLPCSSLCDAYDKDVIFVAKRNKSNIPVNEYLKYQIYKKHFET